MPPSISALMHRASHAAMSTITRRQEELSKSDESTDESTLEPLMVVVTIMAVVVVMVVIMVGILEMKDLLQTQMSS